MHPSTGTDNLTSLGSLDNFIQKLDPNGNLIWAKQIGGTELQFAYDMVLDSIDNIFITGSFRGTVDFDPSNSVYSMSAGSTDNIFILKLDYNGNFQWVKDIGNTTGHHLGFSIAVDTSGAVYVTGYFRNNCDFDPSSTNLFLPSNGETDAFLVKFDQNGNLIWVNTVGGTGSDSGRSITTDRSGFLYLTGSFTDTVDLDPGSSISNFSSFGGRDFFIQKLDLNGNALWTKSFGSIGSDIAFSIKVDDFGNIYTTGQFSEIAYFDTNMTSLNLVSNGETDIFVMKQENNGNILWVKQMGGQDIDYGADLIIDNQGSVHTIGSFESAVDFDPGANTSNIISNGDRDIFIQKLDQNGDFEFVEHFGGVDNDYGRSITLDVNGSILVTGQFYDTVNFDPGLDSAIFISAGLTDVFIQKFVPCQNSFGTDVHVACYSYEWIDGLTYTADNNTATFLLSNSNGCDSLVTLDLTITSVSDVSLLIGSSIILANNNSASSYQWLDCGNNYSIIPNETNLFFEATENGVYAVEIAENGCVDTSDCAIIDQISIRNYEKSKLMAIYPNPANTFFNIAFENNVSSAEISIFSTEGKWVKSASIYQTDSVDIDDLSTGIYYVLVEIGKEQHYIKLIKN